MQLELQRLGLGVELESPIKVKYQDTIVGDFRADLLVSGVVIVELKAARIYNPDNEPQLLKELKAAGTKLAC